MRLFGVLALLVLAACNGPTVRHDPAGSGHYAVTVRVDPPNLQDGQKATFNYSFTDTRSDKQAINLPLVDNATVRTTVVNHDMTWFRTGKASGPVGGAYPVNLRFGPPGLYNLYAEFSSGYTPTERLLYTHTVAFGIDAPSVDTPAPLIESSNLENAFYGVAVKLDTGGPIHAKQPALIHYTLSTGGTPVRDLAPFDGAAAHLFVISANREEFEHLYAQEGANGAMNTQREPSAGGGSGADSGNPAAPGRGVPTPPDLSAPATPPAGATPGAAPANPPLGPNLTFVHVFPQPGLYKMWMQFLYHGETVTADYVVNVVQ